MRIDNSIKFLVPLKNLPWGYRLLIFSSISILLFFILVPLGGYGGHHIKYFFSVSGYCMAAFVISACSNNYKEKFTASVILLLPPSILIVPIYFIDGKINFNVSTLSTFGHYVGFFFGMALSTYRRMVSLSYILLLVMVLSSIWITVFGYKLYVNFLNFDSLTGKVAYFINNFTLYDKEGKILKNDDFEGKTVILDFWNTGCKPCFDKFPVVQDLYEKYSSTSDLKIYAVNVPIKRDSIGFAKARFDEMGYSFPSLYAKNDEIMKTFDFKVFPTSFVLLNGNKIIYKGHIETIDEIIDSQLKM